MSEGHGPFEHDVDEDESIFFARERERQKDEEYQKKFNDLIRSRQQGLLRRENTPYRSPLAPYRECVWEAWISLLDAIWQLTLAAWDRIAFWRNR